MASSVLPSNWRCERAVRHPCEGGRKRRGTRWHIHLLERPARDVRRAEEGVRLRRQCTKDLQRQPQSAEGFSLDASKDRLGEVEILRVALEPSDHRGLDPTTPAQATQPTHPPTPVQRCTDSEKAMPVSSSSADCWPPSARLFLPLCASLCKMSRIAYSASSQGSGDSSLRFITEKKEKADSTLESLCEELEPPSSPSASAGRFVPATKARWVWRRDCG